LTGKLPELGGTKRGSSGDWGVVGGTVVSVVSVVLRMREEKG